MIRFLVLLLSLLSCEPISQTNPPSLSESKFKKTEQEVTNYFASQVQPLLKKLQRFQPDYNLNLHPQCEITHQLTIPQFQEFLESGQVSIQQKDVRKCEESLNFEIILSQCFEKGLQFLQQKSLEQNGQILFNPFQIFDPEAEETFFAQKAYHALPWGQVLESFLDLNLPLVTSTLPNFLKPCLNQLKRLSFHSPNEHHEFFLQALESPDPEDLLPPLRLLFSGDFFQTPPTPSPETSHLFQKAFTSYLDNHPLRIHHPFSTFFQIQPQTQWTWKDYPPLMKALTEWDQEKTYYENKLEAQLNLWDQWSSSHTVTKPEDLPDFQEILSSRRSFQDWFFDLETQTFQEEKMKGVLSQMQKTCEQMNPEEAWQICLTESPLLMDIQDYFEQKEEASSLKDQSHALPLEAAWLNLSTKRKTWKNTLNLSLEEWKKKTINLEKHLESFPGRMEKKNHHFPQKLSSYMDHLNPVHTFLSSLDQLIAQVPKEELSAIQPQICDQLTRFFELEDLKRILRTAAFFYKLKHFQKSWSESIKGSFHKWLRKPLKPEKLLNLLTFSADSFFALLDPQQQTFSERFRDFYEGLKIEFLKSLSHFQNRFQQLSYRLKSLSTFHKKSQEQLKPYSHLSQLCSIRSSQ